MCELLTAVGLAALVFFFGWIIQQGINEENAYRALKRMEQRKKEDDENETK